MLVNSNRGDSNSGPYTRSYGWQCPLVVFPCSSHPLTVFPRLFVPPACAAAPCGAVTLQRPNSKLATRTKRIVGYCNREFDVGISIWAFSILPEFYQSLWGVLCKSRSICSNLGFIRSKVILNNLLHLGKPVRCWSIPYMALKDPYTKFMFLLDIQV